MAETGQPGEPRRPRGMFDSRVDERGRLKLNEEIRRYFIETGNTQLFVTSFDGRTALLYPISVWEQAEQLLESPGPDGKAGKQLWQQANWFGSDAEIDNQGRVLLPPRLRKQMAVENSPVHMAFFRGHLEVFSAKDLEATAPGDIEGIVETFVNLGLR